MSDRLASAGRAVVTLLTDFGTRDGYVGAMKGVIASICPGASIHDIAHDIAPGQIRAGAFALAAAAPYFPAGTVHVAVVDPGVGSERRPLLVESGGQLFVGPDNGLLSQAAATPRVVRVLDRPGWFREPVSSTFHGRDVFAPVAAHAAAGVDVDELGSTMATMVALEVASPSREHDGVTGEILHADRFGNLVTNIERSHLPGDIRVVQVSVGTTAVGPLVRTYADAAVGTLMALFGSGGRLEIAERDGSAASRLGRDAAAGTPVSVRGAPPVRRTV